MRVLDFTWAWAGPFCTQTLAHLGAEVIRVETHRAAACVTRMIPPFADDQPGPNRAGYFNQYNQGKRSILLDLHKPEAVKLAYQLVEALRRRGRQFRRRRDRASSASATRSCARSNPTSSRSRCPVTASTARSAATSATARRRRRCRGCSG